MLEFPSASKCQHLKYGQVVLPSGKMSSRDGNVVFFSELKQQLLDEVRRKLFFKHTESGDGERWTEDEIASSCHRMASATIRYRMLNACPTKPIEFDLSTWTAKSGDTGPYLLYTYGRALSFVAHVHVPDGVPMVFDAATHCSDSKDLEL
jgi:arginyl-tRNA synthetase